MDSRQIVREWTRIRGRDLHPCAVLLLYYFSNVVNKNGELWPSWIQITEQTGMSRRALSRNLPSLKQAGVLVSVGRVRQVTKYKLDFEKMYRDLEDAGVITTLLSKQESVITTPLSKQESVITTLDKCHHDTTLVSPRHPKDPVDPERSIITLTDDKHQSGDDMVKKADRKKENVEAKPFNQNTLGQTKKQVKVTNAHSLSRWWMYKVKENEGTDSGIAVPLTDKNRAILYGIAKKLDYNWDVILPMLEHNINNWVDFKMEVQDDHAAKIGYKPMPGVLSKYLDTAMGQWQLIANKPLVTVLQIEPEPIKIPIQPKKVPSKTVSDTHVADVLEVLAGFKKGV
jgi:hypothetical protein